MTTNAPIELPTDARRRLDTDHVVWLTTVTDSGAPAPNPVWFVLDGDDIVVFSEPASRKVHNIGRRADVAVHFNSDAEGGDVVIINGVATMRRQAPPSSLSQYIDKYEPSITGPLAMTVDELDRDYNAEIRIRPTRVRVTPA